MLAQTPSTASCRPLRPQEALETTCVHSVAGTLPPNQSLITTRPLRAPHHTISDAGLIGGGTIPKPGEVSMAHHGVLFLDEVLEFKRSVLDGLRQPLEDGTVTVTRVNASLQYPARFMLIVAMNPCPCGHYGDRTRECICTPQQIRRYRGRLSGPLRDRLDIHVEVPAVPVADLGHEQVAERSMSIQKRVADARHVQANRYQDDNLFTNAQPQTQTDANPLPDRRNRPDPPEPGRHAIGTLGKSVWANPSRCTNHCGFGRLRNDSTPASRRGHPISEHGSGNPPLTRDSTRSPSLSPWERARVRERFLREAYSIF